MLSNTASDLKQAGLSLLRISWHTTDPEKYRQISGHGDYRKFKAGIEAAVEAKLLISFNRLLLRGSTQDLPVQLDFVQKHGLRIKLYDLMWTPEIAANYDSFYEDWRSVIRTHVLPRTEKIERIRSGLRRNRLRFRLHGGSFVEVKIGDGIDRKRQPCLSCPHKAKCLEMFGDYLRVEPDLQAYFCYLRRDIGFNLRTILQQTHGHGGLVREKLREHFGQNMHGFIATTRLRFIISPYCNYNCFFPGTTISWCHKNTGDYSFPGRPRLASLQNQQAIFETAWK